MVDWKILYELLREKLLILLHAQNFQIHYSLSLRVRQATGARAKVEKILFVLRLLLLKFSQLESLKLLD